MATLYITEYAAGGALASSPTGGNLTVPREPGTDQTPVTFTTAAASAAFGATTRFVRLQADAACHVQFGSSPTATANHQPLNADTEYFRAVAAGDKVSVYDGTS